MTSTCVRNPVNSSVDLFDPKSNSKNGVRMYEVNPLRTSVLRALRARELSNRLLKGAQEERKPLMHTCIFLAIT